jgi:hypothetical protein
MENLYKHHLQVFKDYNTRISLGKLLGIRLVEQRKLFIDTMEENGKFFKQHEDIIIPEIRKICKDFKVTNEEIINEIEKTIRFNPKTFAEDAIWFVFEEGIGMIIDLLRYRNYLTCEDYFKFHDSFEDNEEDKIVPSSLVEPTFGCDKLRL